MLSGACQAKDLKAEDLNGTSDPVVEVTAFGRKQTTRVHKNVTSCVFDETFVFMLPNLKVHEVEQGTIKVCDCVWAFALARRLDCRPVLSLHPSLPRSLLHSQ
jgi:hypothetical protein